MSTIYSKMHAFEDAHWGEKSKCWHYVVDFLHSRNLLSHMKLQNKGGILLVNSLCQRFLKDNET